MNGFVLNMTVCLLIMTGIIFLPFSSIWYLYCDKRRKIWWNIPWARGKSWGRSPRDFTVYSDSIHKTDILNNNSSIVVFPWISILEEFILHIALAAGAFFPSILPALLGVYWKIYSELYSECTGNYTPSTLPVLSQ